MAAEALTTQTPAQTNVFLHWAETVIVTPSSYWVIELVVDLRVGKSGLIPGPIVPPHAARLADGGSGQRAWKIPR
jgi:hypothetical protein